MSAAQESASSGRARSVEVTRRKAQPDYSQVDVAAVTDELRAVIFAEGHDVAGQAYEKAQNAPAPLLHSLSNTFADPNPMAPEDKKVMYDLRNDAQKVTQHPHMPPYYTGAMKPEYCAQYALRGSCGGVTCCLPHRR